MADVAEVTEIELETPSGPARAHLRSSAGEAAGTLLLGHGAGGGVGAPDLVAASGAAHEAGFGVVAVEQPYRVAGRRSPAAAARLDAAWTAVIDQLRERRLLPGALVAGGRSAGARVACRTAAATGAAGVLCLAFPVHPPGKADDPSKSRQSELDAVTVPTLVIQGESDPFGMPAPGPQREIVTVAGNHGLKEELPRLSATVERWLAKVVAA